MSKPNRVANPWISGLGHYDSKYYVRARACSDLLQMDYNLARVFNNQAYSNLLQLDTLSQIETAKLKILPSVPDSHEDVSDASLLATIERMLEQIGKLTSEVDQELAKKALSWYLITTSLLDHLSPKDAPAFIFEYAQTIYVNAGTSAIRFNHLHALCGSRHSAQKARDILASVLNDCGDK